MRNDEPPQPQGDPAPASDRHGQRRPGRAGAFGWRLGALALAGVAGGAIAGLTAVLLFRGLYSVSFAAADNLDGWLAFGAFTIALVVCLFVSGLLGGLAGGLVSGALVARLVRPPRLWLRVWRVMWMVGGLGVWLLITQHRGADPAIGIETGRWWMLLGGLLALGFAWLAPRPDAGNR